MQSKTSTKLYLGVFLLIFFFSHQLNAQVKRPKLVVGIVVDQMKQEYLQKYFDKFGDNGFKRLLKNGFSCQNNHYNYVPTSTGPGHASIYTGTVPAYHGIVNNDWTENGQRHYCADDSTVKGVGSITAAAMSPKNMLVTTFGDQLRLATQMKGKSVGISLKDRGACLPAGHAANAAFWYDKVSGKFVSSTYYMEKLPQWLIKYNQKQRAAKILKQKWMLSLPIHQYTESIKDDNPHEQKIFGKSKPTFPYDLKAMAEYLKKKAQFKASPYGIITYTPFGNTLVKEVALEALRNEDLGKDEYTDLLAISFSSTDIAGHAFGGQSIELEDIYIKLDKEIADILNALDKEVGKNNYLLFLTADHAVADVPSYSQSLKLPGGYVDTKALFKSLNQALLEKYGTKKIILTKNSKEIYFDKEEISKQKIDKRDLENFVADELRKSYQIFDALTATQLQNHAYNFGLKQLYQNSYFHRRSPDIFIIPLSGWLNDGWKNGGSSHGTAYTYDTHVPLLWYGWNVPQGSTNQKTHITDIATTLSLLLKIPLPSACIGRFIKW